MSVILCVTAKGRAYPRILGSESETWPCCGDGTVLPASALVDAVTISSFLLAFQGDRGNLAARRSKPGTGMSRQNSDASQVCPLSLGCI